MIGNRHPFWLACSLHLMLKKSEGVKWGDGFIMDGDSLLCCLNFPLLVSLVQSVVHPNLLSTFLDIQHWDPSSVINCWFPLFSCKRPRLQRGFSDLDHRHTLWGFFQFDILIAIPVTHTTNWQGATGEIFFFFLRQTVAQPQFSAPCLVMWGWWVDKEYCFQVQK